MILISYKKLLSTLLLASLLLSLPIQATNPIVYEETELTTTGTPHSVPLLLEIESPVFSVMVPTALPCYLPLEGDPMVAEEACINNLSNQAIQVTEIQVTPADGWSLKEYDTELAKNQFALKINDNTSTEGSFQWNSFMLAKGEELPLDYLIQAGTYEAGLESTSIAHVAFVVDWYYDGPYEIQATGTKLYDGSTLVRIGTPLQLNAVQTMATDIATWESSNPSVATVSANGLVTPVEPGEAVISFGEEEFPISVQGRSAAVNSSTFSPAGDISIAKHYNKSGVWYTSTDVPAQAFKDCTKLTSIVLPDSVTIIDSNAFGGCTSLKSITIPDSVTRIGNAFVNCSSLESIVLPKKLAHLTQSIFNNCTALKSVKIYNVPKIENIFTDCTALEEIYIPKTVTNIGQHDFRNTTKLKDVYYEGSKEEWDLITKHDGSVYTNHLLSATIHYNVEF